jgi:hypothetical protein
MVAGIAGEFAASPCDHIWGEREGENEGQTEGEE